MNCPVWLFYLTNVTDYSSMICMDSITNICYGFLCSACWQSSRILIIVDRMFLHPWSVSTRKSFVAHHIISKGFLYTMLSILTMGFCSSFFSLKQNLIQILCSLKSTNWLKSKSPNHWNKSHKITLSKRKHRKSKNCLLYTSRCV